MQYPRAGVLILAPFVAGYYLSYLFRTINALISDRLAAELALTAAQLGLLTAAYFVTFAAIQLPLGVWLDRHGPRRVQCMLLSTAAVGATTFSLAGGFVSLLIGRALIGLGVAGALMAGLKAIALWFPKERATLLNGLFVTFGALGAVTATAPAEVLLDMTGWRGLFVMLAPATAFCAAAIFLVVPDHSDDYTGRGSREKRPEENKIEATARPCATSGHDPQNSLLADQGPNCFDRHQHNALAKRGAQETVPLIELNRSIVDRVGDHAPHPRDLRCCEAPSQGVGQERRSHASTAPLHVDGQSPDQQQRHSLGHSTT